MTLHESRGRTESTGKAMHELMRELYPICRSITGEGVRETLRILRRDIPLEVHEVPTGTRVFDWTIPKEWTIRDAWIRNASGEKVVDFSQSNLHVLNYSIPVHTRIPMEDLAPHLHSLPEYPDWIPYLTSYYHENWGFCISERQRAELGPGPYEVCIDSSLKDGFLTYGEYVLPGLNRDEVLLSTYLCHPSLCNDNLSGVVLLAFLAQNLEKWDRRYTYRFLFVPETIGAIAWLARNQDGVERIRHGLVSTCVGDPGMATYQRSRWGNAEVDRAVEKALQDSGEPYRVRDFIPYGSDERQYSSPGFNLPVGSLMRTPYGEFPEYHTSADNLNVISARCLEQSLQNYLAALRILDQNRTFRSTNPKCEPMLGRRGLYGRIGSRKTSPLNEMALLWTLNFSDGSHSLLDIAIRSGLRFPQIQEAASALVAQGLLVETGSASVPRQPARASSH